MQEVGRHSHKGSQQVPTTCPAVGEGCVPIALQPAHTLKPLHLCLSKRPRLTGYASKRAMRCSEELVMT